MGAAAAAAALALTTVCASAAVIPYMNSFDSSGFTDQAGFTLNPGAGTLTANTSANNAVLTSYGSEQFSNATNLSYSISSQFTISAYGTASGDQAVGLGAFGLDSAFTGTSDATRWVQASWVFNASTTANNGLLRLIEVDGSNTTLATTTVDLNGGTVGAVNVGTTLTLRLNVINTAPNSYNLNLALLNADATSVLGSISYNDYAASAAPLNGYYMGLRDRIPNFSGTTTLTHNDFNVAVIPEPSSFTLLAVSLVGLSFASARRRRGGRD